MSRLLAVELCRREMRCVVATPHGPRLSIQAAFATPLPTAAGEQPSAADDRPDFAALLRSELDARKLGSPLVLVGVDRADVELLYLSLPPAKDDELPEMVLNEAMRQSPAITEETALDFLPLNDDPQQPRKVLAAGLGAEHRQRIQERFTAAGLRPRRMLLRALGTASLFFRSGPAPAGVVLLVNLLEDEADLTVVAGGKPLYLRTVRLPATIEDDRSMARLIAEIKRTLAVGVEQAVEGASVAAVRLVAAPGEHRPLLERMGAELEVPVEAFDPLTTVENPSALEAAAGRFAPLLGMLLDEAAGKQPIDFLRPRRSSRPQDQQRQKRVMAVGVVLMLLMAGWYCWDWFGAGDVEVTRLNRQFSELNAQIKKAGQSTKVAAAIRDWKAGDVNWLDELRDLSTRLPSGRDLVLLRMTLSSASKGAGGGGEIDMQGLVRDQAIVDKIVNNLRDEYHRIYPKRVQERLPERAYAWHFIASVAVAKRDKSQYRPPAAETPPASGAATAPAAAASTATPATATTAAPTATTATPTATTATPTATTATPTAATATPAATTTSAAAAATPPTAATPATTTTAAPAPTAPAPTATTPAATTPATTTPATTTPATEPAAAPASRKLRSMRSSSQVQP